jgi:hypothetical protein
MVKFSLVTDLCVSWLLDHSVDCSFCQSSLEVGHLLCFALRAFISVNNRCVIDCVESQKLSRVPLELTQFIEREIRRQACLCLGSVKPLDCRADGGNQNCSVHRGCVTQAKVQNTAGHAVHLTRRACAPGRLIVPGSCTSILVRPYCPQFNGTFPTSCLSTVACMSSYYELIEVEWMWIHLYA